ncbi:MAG: 3-deoxy-D-manno-octulosonic acid transferase [Rhodovibrio sp.]|nr:3-deoxy-D-manno-octulosonic acid transferase [Rhodovibrio sp.]
MTAYSLYRVLTFLAGPALRVYLYRRVTRGKEEKGRLRERFGVASQPRPSGPLVWLHAASVGESLSLLPLVEALRTREPALNVLVTSGTVTSARLLQTRLPTGVIHQYNPIDRAAWVRRFLDHWRPDLALYVESELWPNLLGITQARGIPTGLLNARMSESSFRNWRRMPSFIHPLMAGFQFCLAQNPTQAERMAALGARNPRPLGNLKCAAKPLAVDPDALAELRRAVGGRPCWLAASTHAGEEAVAAEVHASLRARHPGLLTVVAPRHPERAGEVARLLHGRGLRVAQRSRDGIASLDGDVDVYLVDTLGELGLFYSLCPVAFVGGSLGDAGGHNPIEPARLGCAVVHGPDMRAFSEIAEDLGEPGGSWQVRDADGLTRAVDRLLAEPDTRAHQADAARAVAEGQAGVLDAVLGELDPYLAPLRPSDGGNAARRPSADPEPDGPPAAGPTAAS